MRDNILTYSLCFGAALLSQFATCQPAVIPPAHEHKSVAEKFQQLSTSSCDLEVIANDTDADFIDLFNPLGPKAQLLYRTSNKSKEKHVSVVERGLWINFKNELFLYRDQKIWLPDAAKKLKQVDQDQSKKILKKTVKTLHSLENSSPYARNIISTLQNSCNKFVIKLADINESYTLFPIADKKLGFLNNEAYAFQVIDQEQLMIDYAPFDKIGSGAEMRWTPALGLIKLAHELSHAYDANYGLLDDRLMPAYGEVMSAREIRALYHENIIRKELKVRMKYKANTGSALIWQGMPFTYPLPVCARY
ncbi:M91 family zinc metallopeptidase [Ekhidna sp. To15]|uniref:M91 family zinc metallopeptidase n=1 Tax=Ekhidna sp. To15 TaxID=3395267 RepID=UPI003F520112